MCGIVGFFDIERKPLSCGGQGSAHPYTPYVRAAMDQMTARGPDDEGMYATDHVILGHKRLSIIDIEGGHQPFTDKTTGTTIVFNGEIFNFKQLRALLVSRGHTFQTTSDTEVLLHSYLEWNTSCLEKLSGMFAFAIYDPQRDMLFAARDRLGIKPFFFHNNKKFFVFASSIPALRCFPQISAEMDIITASHYLSTIRTTIGHRTMLRDIQTLLPGEYLTITPANSEPSIRKYWDIPIISPADKERPEITSAIQHVHELVSNSVAEQLISDVPLGGFLSGGLDSSIIAALACRMTGNNYNAYSTGYDREGYNEWSFIRSAAEFYKMNCREIHLNEADYPATWLKIIKSKGAPISTPNEIPIFHLSQALKNDFTVALSGEGADEIFGGYIIPYFSAFDYDRARKTAPGKNEPLSPLDITIQRLYRRPYLLCRPDHYFLVNSWIPLAQKPSLLTDDTWHLALNRDQHLFDFYENQFDQLKQCSTMDSYMHIHARVNLEGLLSRVDSSTMAASVEARVPFTDHRIVEYLFSLPDDYKINWRNGCTPDNHDSLNITEIDKHNLLESKILLRRAFATKVPNQIIERKKMSFPVPFQEWMSSSMLETAKSAILHSPLSKTFFNHSFIEQTIRTANLQTSAMTLWPVMNLCTWQQECNIKAP